jgi:hypothetical protein
MKLNKIEKIIIAVILLGLILVGGSFLLVVPGFEQIGKNTKELAANLEEKAALEEKLSRLDTIDADITQNQKDAKQYEGSFYPDLTTYETSELAMAYLTAAGLEAHQVEISALSTRNLTLEYYMPVDVEYDLKAYGAAANSNDKEVLLEGEFYDGKKKYTVSASTAVDVQITDEDGAVVAPSKYTDTMKKYYCAAVCRCVQLNGLYQTVGFTSATYHVKGKASDYDKFIDHIYSLERATMFEAVEYPMTITIDEDPDSDKQFVGEDGILQTGDEANGKLILVEPDTEIEVDLTIVFLSVEPMEPIKDLNADGTTVVVDQRPAVY